MFSQLLRILCSFSLLSVAFGVKLYNIDPCSLTQLKLNSKASSIYPTKCNGLVKSPASVRQQPSVTYNEADKTSLYVLLMVDPDAPRWDDPKSRYWRHWLITDITGSALLSGIFSGKETTYTEYAGPTPPEGSGKHRYQLFLFDQPSYVNRGRLNGLLHGQCGKFDLISFVADAGMQPPVAGFQYRTEQPPFGEM